MTAPLYAWGSILHELIVGAAFLTVVILTLAFVTIMDNLAKGNEK